MTDLTRPIIGIENRTAREVFDIMCDRIRSAALSVPSQGAVKDAEFLAQYLHDECEWPEFDFPQHSWPDHPDDDGKRGDGYLKIVPKSSADEFRSLAQRILSALHSPAHSGEREALELENKRLRELLLPFARVADMELKAGPADSVIVNVARCRDAREFLRRKP